MEYLRFVSKLIWREKKGLRGAREGLGDECNQSTHFYMHVQNYHNKIHYSVQLIQANKIKLTQAEIQMKQHWPLN